MLAALALVGGWVWWKGGNPDPALFAAAPSLQRRGPVELDRGPLPDDLVPAGWSERSLAVFGPVNVYEKINGREGFYKSYGFEPLSFVTAVGPADPTRGVDVEIYDLGSDANALGCLSAEAGPDRPPQITDQGVVRREDNARFLARGP